ncbi:MAG: hypothetical protein ACPGUD_10295 [Parashewanella sp.]
MVKLFSYSASTYRRLTYFILSVSLICVSALYVELYKQNQILAKQVKKLTASQVLLMVPDEHSEQLKEWLASHPESIDSLLKQGQLSTEKFDGSVHRQALKINKSQQQTVSHKQTVKPNTKATIGDNGFKDEKINVQQLPHGGIRVTTREQ